MNLSEILSRKNLPSEETEIILTNLLKKDRSFLYAFPETKLSNSQIEAFFAFENRRVNQEPLAYIIGFQEFYGRKFLVNSGVLIPRPETEEIVDKVLDFTENRPAKIVDIGTGSGCIAITLKLQQPNLKVIATDISSEALITARKNSRLFGIDNQITFTESDLLKSFTEKVDVVVANLPYIPTANWKKLPKQIKDFEPRLALDSGASKDSLYKTLFLQAKGILKPKGKLFYEIDGDIFEMISTDSAG